MIASGAMIKGLDQVLANIEKKLGHDKVKRVANKVLRETSQEFEPHFKRAITVYAATGLTVKSVVYSRVSGTLGVPTVKIGFGEGSRWRLVHLSEFGYSKKRNPRGFGIIRRFSEANKSVFKAKVHSKLRGAFFNGS